MCANFTPCGVPIQTLRGFEYRSFRNLARKWMHQAWIDGATRRSSRHGTPGPPRPLYAMNISPMFLAVSKEPFGGALRVRTSWRCGAIDGKVAHASLVTGSPVGWPKRRASVAGNTDGRREDGARVAPEANRAGSGRRLLGGAPEVRLGGRPPEHWRPRMRRALRLLLAAPLADGVVHRGLGAARTGLGRMPWGKGGGHKDRDPETPYTTPPLRNGGGLAQRPRPRTNHPIHPTTGTTNQ